MISKAIDRAYRIMRQRNWDTIYWAIDLHGVCLKANYKQGGYEWINSDVLEGLKAIRSRPESKMIIWSGVIESEKAEILKFFADNGVPVDYFNENPEEVNTAYSNFDEKFYFSILLDDKAGFDPDTDWQVIMEYLYDLEVLSTAADLSVSNL